MFRGGDSAADLGAQGAAADAVGKDHHAVAIGKPGLEPGAVGIVRAAVAEPPRSAVTVEKPTQSDPARPHLRHHVTCPRRRAAAFLAYAVGRERGADRVYP